MSDEEQKMVKKSLEIIFGGLVVVSRHMLHSHLKEGVFSTITEELKKEASSVSTTNAAAERLCNAGQAEEIETKGLRHCV